VSNRPKKGARAELIIICKGKTSKPHKSVTLLDLLLDPGEFRGIALEPPGVPGAQGRKEIHPQYVNEADNEIIEEECPYCVGPHGGHRVYKRRADEVRVALEAIARGQTRVRKADLAGRFLT
jgi:hypothetical protein